MRIGIFTHNYPRDNNDRKNAGVFVADFARKLATDHSVYIFCPSNQDLVEERGGVTINWFKWNGTTKEMGKWAIFSPLSLYFFYKLMSVGSRKALGFARENKLDYCLATWSLPSSIFTFLVKRKLSIPYGVWNLGSDINLYVKIPILRQLITLSLLRADHLFANSYSLSDKVSRLVNRRCLFLPAVTEFVSGKNTRFLKNHKISTFLYVGRLEKVKGPDLLIKACRLMKRKGVNFRLNILGGGNLLKKLKKMVKEYSITANVSFEGWADKEKIARFMKKADVLVIPSRDESLPLVLIESARFNLPVIVSRVGDCSRIVKKYNIGSSYKKGNVSELAKIMTNFAKTKKLNINSKGFAKMLETYSLDEAARKFLKEIS